MFNLLCRASRNGGVGFLRNSGLRICISLKPYDIEIIEGNGTEEKPYIIGNK